MLHVNVIVDIVLDCNGAYGAVFLPTMVRFGEKLEHIHFHMSFNGSRVDEFRYSQNGFKNEYILRILKQYGLAYRLYSNNFAQVKAEK
jgi:hypothetical protein